MELLDSLQPNTPSWDEARDIEASFNGIESAYEKIGFDEGWWTKITNDMFLMGKYTHQMKGNYTGDTMSLGRFARNACPHLRLNNNRFIDKTDVDENVYAAFVLRSGFTRTSKISWHSNYWCDSNLMEQNLKEVEASQHGFYVNMVIKAFPFFPEELPNNMGYKVTVQKFDELGRIPFSRTLSVGNVPRKCRQRDLYAFKMKGEIRLLGQPLLCNLSRETEYKNFSRRILLVRMFSFTSFEQKTAINVYHLEDDLDQIIETTLKCAAKMGKNVLGFIIKDNTHVNCNATYSNDIQELWTSRGKRKTNTRRRSYSEEELPEKLSMEAYLEDFLEGPKALLQGMFPALERKFAQGLRAPRISRPGLDKEVDPTRAFGLKHLNSQLLLYA
ncbi:hypothetical protein LguiB_005320 [Lonicera macranthoides]